MIVEFIIFVSNIYANCTLDEKTFTFNYIYGHFCWSFRQF
ncbi:hypothetical protein CHRY9390_02363 [Chryseobacterium aquaeductus]|uniref:Uncharacterized protein n=1 Tax=Chryseobacterium aquaeductus TaxID=2675056 RepID=A0A9N8MHR9_9FLAO|nr:hypothetical protein CHRY9390_02363 [Chryseobacterium potabilaquae]CAD7811479.1 hypothetical protein CHRY9390_02363 [Chryseobacterium aquaeductus]